jgi:hypothetical protein
MSNSLTRRDLLIQAGLAATAVHPAFITPDSEPIVLNRGPHLFIDDFLIAEHSGITRRVMNPERLPDPVLTSARFGTTQPYLGLLRDPDSGRLRLWYNHGNQIWYTESTDGIAWGEPRIAWDLERCFGVTVIDDRGRDPDPQRRFKLANWRATWENKPGDDSGMFVGFSPDGFNWSGSSANPVLRTWPEGPDKPLKHGVGDIIDAFYDPVHKLYGCAVKVHAIPGKVMPRGRVPATSTCGVSSA